jgi:hypothetical protein
MTNANGERSWLRRIIYGFLWAPAFYVLTNFFIGVIIGFPHGLRAGASDSGSEWGALAGQRAAADFFQQFGSIILLVQISIFAVLCFYSLLPGVGKYPKRRMP